MIERVKDATYTAVKGEEPLPPCDNYEVTVTAVYQVEITLEDGDQLSDIDTTYLAEGSTATDGNTTYEWDGSQWVLKE